MDAVSNYWKAFAKRYQLDQSPAELRYEYTKFYRVNQEWGLRDEQMFADRVNESADPRFGKDTAHDFWKKLARDNGIPQTHVEQLSEASIVWMRKGNPWDAPGQRAFAKVYREGLRGLPVGVPIEWIDFAQIHGIPMELWSV